MAIENIKIAGRDYLKITDVTFGKLSIRFPEKKYQSDDMIFRAECIVNKKDYKELKKMFKKGSFEEIDTEDFQARLKIEPPFPDEDEQHVARFSASTTYKDRKTGEQKPIELGMNLRPKVYEIVDGVDVDVTMTKYINQGSKGYILVSTSDTQFGFMGYLRSVHLDHVVEYIKPE